MLLANEINQIFRTAINDYHIKDHVDTLFIPKYENDQLKGLLYEKNWTDTVQWHLEDIIRSLDIDPLKLVKIKRRIDKSNQYRTDIVEEIDEYIYDIFSDIEIRENAKLNSETPAWLLDRMSILQLKIYHFEEETKRDNLEPDHLNMLFNKLYILKEQEKDLQVAFDDLMNDLGSGRKYMKLYKQMKMYNDPKLNPVLYQ